MPKAAPKPKWTGDVADIVSKGWKYFHEPKKDDAVLLDKITVENRPYWDWETDKAIGFAQAGDDTAKIKKKINVQRKAKKDTQVKDKARVKAQEVKKGTFVVKEKHTQAKGENIVATAESGLQKLREEIIDFYENNKWEDTDMYLDNFDHSMEDGFTFDPRLLLCSIKYPDMNKHVLEESVAQMEGPVQKFNWRENDGRGEKVLLIHL